jgi:predicted Zn finger-like uncharacterized protein
MLIVCPNCETAYRVDPSALGTAGRQARCVRCQNVRFAWDPAAFSAIAQGFKTEVEALCGSACSSYSVNSSIEAPVSEAVDPSSGHSSRHYTSSPISEQVPEQERRSIRPYLRPDHPLEPSTQVRRRTGDILRSRIAASQTVLGPAKPLVDLGVDRIAAARSAARAASAEASARSSVVAKRSGKFSQRVRSLVSCASVVLFVIGPVCFVGIVLRFLSDTDVMALSEAMPQEPRTTARTVPPITTDQAGMLWPAPTPVRHSESSGPARPRPF